MDAYENLTRFNSVASMIPIRLPGVLLAKWLIIYKLLIILSLVRVAWPPLIRLHAQTMRTKALNK